MKNQKPNEQAKVEEKGTPGIAQQEKKRSLPSQIIGILCAHILFIYWVKAKNLPVEQRAHGMTGLALAVFISIFQSVPPIRQSQVYHSFADDRCLCCSVPNTFDVLSNIPFLFVGFGGLDYIFSGPISTSFNFPTPHFKHKYEKESWAAYFAGVALVSIGSAYYHWKPNNARLVWDRLPMSIAFGSLYYIVISETSHYENPLLMLGLIAFSVFSVILWALTDDLRCYIFVQFYFLCSIPIYYTIFSDQVRYDNYYNLFIALGFYAAAKITEKFDREIYNNCGKNISGHTMKHLLAAVSTGWGIIILIGRQ